MSVSLSIVIFVIVLALIFDFINGFHDSANSIATIVSTKVLKPYQAVMWAAFFNFVAILLFDSQVAKPWERASSTPLLSTIRSSFRHCAAPLSGI
jgi:PiT family inorganic phosphate transporter